MIHLITAVSVIKRSSLYEFTLWGRDLMSFFRIREIPYNKGFFLKKIHESFVGTLETVRIREVSLPVHSLLLSTCQVAWLYFLDALNYYPFFLWLALTAFTAVIYDRSSWREYFFCTTDFRQPKVDIIPQIGSCAISKMSRHAPSSTLQTSHFSPSLQEVTWSVICLIFMYKFSC